MNNFPNNILNHSKCRDWISNYWPCNAHCVGETYIQRITVLNKCMYNFEYIITYSQYTNDLCLIVLLFLFYLPHLLYTFFFSLLSPEIAYIFYRLLIPATWNHLLSYRVYKWCVTFSVAGTCLQMCSPCSSGAPGVTKPTAISCYRPLQSPTCEGSRCSLEPISRYCHERSEWKPFKAR